MNGPEKRPRGRPKLSAEEKCRRGKVRHVIRLHRDIRAMAQADADAAGAKSLPAHLAKIVSEKAAAMEAKGDLQLPDTVWDLNTSPLNRGENRKASKQISVFLPQETEERLQRICTANGYHPAQIGKVLAKVIVYFYFSAEPEEDT